MRVLRIFTISISLFWFPRKDLVFSLFCRHISFANEIFFVKLRHFRPAAQNKIFNLSELCIQCNTDSCREHITDGVNLLTAADEFSRQPLLMDYLLLTGAVVLIHTCFAE